MMRLGKYSGKVYEEIEIDTMQECGVCITDEQSKDEDWILKHHLKDLIDCLKCGFGCPLSRKGNIINLRE